MSFLENFKHSRERVNTRFNDFFGVIVFISIVIFAFLFAMQAGNLVQGMLKSNFEKIGINVLNISTLTNSNPERFGMGRQDLEFFQSELGKRDISSVQGVLSRCGEAKVMGFSLKVLIRGVTNRYRDFYPIEMLGDGAFINQNDYENVKQVVVVSNSFAIKYFKKIDVLNENITLKNPEGKTRNFSIAGVMKENPSFVTNAFRTDVFEVYIPLTTAQEFFGAKTFDSMDIKVSPSASIDVVAQRVVKLMEDRHGAGSGYFAKKAVTVIQSGEEVKNLVKFYIEIVGSISILVGLLGIAMVMNKIVVIRSTEFALRKLLGASHRDIFFQVAFESMVVTFYGGIGGIMIGVVISLILQYAFGYEIIDFMGVLITLFASAIIGVLGGIWPARKAVLIEVERNIRFE